MGWIIPCLPSTRFHPTLSQVPGNGNALKEVTGADGARDSAKLKSHMFLTWPYPEMWKIARSIMSALFSPAMIYSVWLLVLLEAHETVVKEPWEMGHLAEDSTCLPGSSHLPHVILCWCCYKAYWAQIQGQAEPDQIPIVFCCQNTLIPSEGRGRRTSVVSLPLNYCVSN